MQKEQPGRRFVLGKDLFFFCILTGNQYSKTGNNKQTSDWCRNEAGNQVPEQLDLLKSHLPAQISVTDSGESPLTDPALLSLLTSFVVGQAVTD